MDNNNFGSNNNSNSNNNNNNNRPRFSLSGNNTNSIGISGNNPQKRPPSRTPGRQSIQPSSFYSNNERTNPINFNTSINNNNNNNPTFLNETTPTPTLKRSSLRYSISGDTSQNYNNKPPLSQSQLQTQKPQPQQPPQPPQPTPAPSIPTLTSNSNFFNKFFSQPSQEPVSQPTVNNNNNNNNNNNINNREDDEMIDYPNESLISSTNSKFRATTNNNIIATPESNFKKSFNGTNSNYLHIPNTPNGSVNSNAPNTPAKMRKKPVSEKIKDVFNYPLDKFDEIQENISTFHHSQYYKSSIYGLALLLNLLLLGYSIDLLNTFFAFLLLLFSIANTFIYFNTTKTSYLYRYEGTTFKSPNMSITQIESPSGSIDNVIVLKSWEPKFPSRVLFTLFSPLHVLIMSIAGPEFDKFVIYTMIAVAVSYSLHYLDEKYEEKIVDEKIIFSQVAAEYNHFMKVPPILISKGTQTFNQ
ncbi:hypothetical protein ACTFIR_007921 [Dictyostelium discoideum]